MQLPVVPLMHQYLTTKSIPGHVLPRNTPVVRDPDNLVYMREEVGGFLVGGFQLNPKLARSRVAAKWRNAGATRLVKWDRADRGASRPCG